MINSGPINSGALNGTSGSNGALNEVVSDGLSASATWGTSFGLYEILSLNISVLDEEPFGSYQRAWADNFTVNETMTDQFINAIIEVLHVVDTLDQMSTRSMSVDEIFTVNDKLLVTLIAIVNENITLVHSYTDLFKLIAILSEVVHVSDSTISQANLKILIASAFTLNDAINISLHAEAVLDSLSVSLTSVEIFKATEALVDILSMDDLPINSVRLSVISTDDLSLSDVLFNSANLSSVIEEDVVFLISFDDGSTTYQGFTMNPETYAVTTYDNYDFNSTTNFDGSYLLANSTGLYRMEGDTDEGTYITSKVKTAALDFGSSNIKQCPKMYLGIDNDASLILRVSIDGAYTAQYQLDLDSEDLSTQIFDIGKGLKGRYWQFDLQTKNNSTFNLDEIELFPITWGRKQR